MGLDLQNDYDKAKSKISAYKTTVETKKTKVLEKKENATTSLDKKKSDVIKQISEIENKSKEFVNKQKNNIKSEVKNQLEQLLDLFKETFPPSENKALDSLRRVFLEAAESTKGKVKSILVDEIVSTLGCSEEQSYQDKVGQEIYIKVSQIDLFKKLIFSPEEKAAKYYYETKNTSVGAIPYSLNRELYNRLQNLGQSYQTQYGSQYFGASGQQLFDIEYVQSYPSNNPTNFGDYYKIVLSQQPNNTNTVIDFLQDYYESIEILGLNTIYAEMLNNLFGGLDFSLGVSTDKLREEKKFDLIIKRIMGICSDPTKKIDVGGTAKLNDLDLIDDSFFEISNQELRGIENDINNITSGLVEFESCDNVKLPINTQGIFSSLDQIINENTISGKVDAMEAALDELSKDPNWTNLVPGLGIDLNIKADIDLNVITQMAKVIYRTVLSPKVMLGFLIMVKAINSNISQTLDDAYDDLTEFMKTFRNFNVNMIRKIFALFVEELFTIIKRDIKKLVEQLIQDIIKEAKSKQLLMYSSILYALLILGEAFIDFRNCKSVVDEILKLLNLGLNQLNIGLPLFALASSKLLGGVSDTRAFANAIENLQKSGLPTGDLPDGSPNFMNNAFKGIIGGMNKEQAENGKTEVYLPPLKVVVPGLAGPGITKPSRGNGKSY
jgi:F0F1-type ATP synthase membrane subunit b/b'